jgi:hypothetical protein
MLEGMGQGVNDFPGGMSNVGAGTMGAFPVSGRSSYTGRAMGPGWGLIARHKGHDGADER